MSEHSSSPRKLIRSLYQHHELIKESTKREVIGRYRGSMLGQFWSFFNPMLMLAVYTFVFGTIFDAKWGSIGNSKVEFAFLLFVGLMIFNVFSECVNRAPGLIVANVNYVKKVVYPLEILPVVSLLTALFHAVISTVVWILAYTIIIGAPKSTIIYFPFIITPFVLCVLGISWALASIGVYLRDVGQILGVFLGALMFLSPIFYSISALPESYRHLLYFNPLAQVIEQSRNVLYFGQMPDFFSVAVSFIIGMIIAWLGFVVFQKTRNGFADVL